MSTAIPSAGVSNSNPTTGASTRTVSASDAVQEFQLAIQQAVDALMAALPVELPAKGKNARKINSLRRQAIPLLSQMLRDDPSLSGAFTADDIDAAMADVTPCTLLCANLTNLQATVANAGSTRLENAWDMADEVYSVAKKRAEGNANIERALTDVKEILAQGPRADTTPVTAVMAQVHADRALARATKAQEKAKAIAAKAAALQTATGDAVVTQGAAATSPEVPGATTVR